MASSVASALNAITRDSGLNDSEALSGFIAEYFADTSSDNEYDSGEKHAHTKNCIRPDGMNEFANCSAVSGSLGSLSSDSSSVSKIELRHAY